MELLLHRKCVSVGFEIGEVEPAPAVLVATKYSQDLGKGAEFNNQTMYSKMAAVDSLTLGLF